MRIRDVEASNPEGFPVNITMVGEQLGESPA